MVNYFVEDRMQFLFEGKETLKEDLSFIHRSFIHIDFRRKLLKMGRQKIISM